MAKVFGKRPAHWQQLQSTKDFLKSLSDVRNLDITSEYIKTTKGSHADGRMQGTWFHRDVAIEFARW